MSPEFGAIVELCRSAEHAEVHDLSLRVDFLWSSQFSDLISTIHPWKTADFVVEGNAYFGNPEDIPPGSRTRATFSGMTGTDRVVLNSAADFLTHSGGSLIARPPSEYYLVKERHCVGDPPTTESIGGLLRLPALIAFLRKIADAAIPYKPNAEQFLFVSAGRIQIRATISEDDLRHVPSLDELSEIQAQITNPPHSESKSGIFKRVLIRQLSNEADDSRLGAFVRKFRSIKENFTADVELFLNEFNFEKVREGFEQRKLDFVLKLNAAGNDLFTKMAAIPVGQGIVLSQMKPDCGSIHANHGLYIGSFILFLFALLMLWNHVHSLRHIDQEIDIERENTAKKFPALSQRISGIYATLRKRSRLQSVWVPLITLTLVVLTFYYTSAVFFSRYAGPIICWSETN